MNRGIKVLQTFALPLGDGTIKNGEVLFITNSAKIHFLRVFVLSHDSMDLGKFLERKTRFELATFALARQRSTTEPLPHIKLK